MPADYLDYLPDGGFPIDLINSIFGLAAVIFLAAIILSINRLRHHFKASTCLKLGFYVFLFLLAIDGQVRTFIYRSLLAAIMDFLLIPFRQQFALFAAL